MDLTRAARWLAPIGLLAFGAVLLTVQRPEWSTAVPVAAVLLLIVWWVTPARRGGGVSHAEAERRINEPPGSTTAAPTTTAPTTTAPTATAPTTTAPTATAPTTTAPSGTGPSPTGDADHTDGPVVVYWRPGCQFCARLRLSLGRLRRQALWVNIWADADAAAFVRSVNHGNETVPTVRVGADTVWTNPPPDQVRTVLRRRYLAGAPYRD